MLFRSKTHPTKIPVYENAQSQAKHGRRGDKYNTKAIEYVSYKNMIPNSKILTGIEYLRNFKEIVIESFWMFQ